MVGDRKRPLAAPIPATAAKRRVTNGSTLDAHLSNVAYRRRNLYSVQNPREVIDRVAEDGLLDLIRGTFKRVKYRWANDMPIGSLDPTMIKVMDGSVILMAQEEDKDYCGRFAELLISVFGESAGWDDMEHLLSFLKRPGLTREEFYALYYHSLLLKRETRAKNVPSLVDRMKNMVVLFRGKVGPWEDAYDVWEAEHHKEVIKLEEAASKNDWVLKVYKYGSYTDSPAERLKLVRNIWQHINEHRTKFGERPLTPYEVGRIIDQIFPNLRRYLFEFLFKLEAWPVLSFGEL